LQLRRACEATADELSSVIGDRTALRSELDQAQLSIDALAAELQETVDKAQAGEARSTELDAQLQESEQARSLAQQQVGHRSARTALSVAINSVAHTRKPRYLENLGQHCNAAQGYLKRLCYAVLCCAAVQLSALQAQVGALEEMTQQLQQQPQLAADGVNIPALEAGLLQGVVQGE
jgi:septal ring factor EnvC (AmiA/AmiB activator)